MKFSALTCTACSISLATFFAVWPARAADLAYAGRLVDAAGAPLAGPVDITLRFYGSAAGSDRLGPTKTFPGVALEGGLFQLTVDLEAQDEAAIFGDGTALVFVEIEAAGKLYPRQRFTHVPLALRIPVDNDSLIYGENAKLTVGEIAIGQVQGLQAALAQKLDSTPASASASGYLSSADWTAFNAKQDAITASSSLTAGSLATEGQDAVVIKPYGTQAGETGELRFEEKTGGNYVAFKAPDTLAASKVWTLPAADGAAGAVLATDGTGGLSWVALGGANILDASITDAKLQTITAPGKVSGAAITSGTIGGSAAFAGSGGVTTSGNITLSPAGSAATELRFQDDDASSYVAFKAPSTVASNLVLTLPTADGSNGQFLKTNGAGSLSWGSPAGAGDMLASANLNDLTNFATARSNLGLGALATLSAVGSSEITNGSLVDADVAASAAIATSKLSGAVTSIAGHGLGSLASLSSVTSTAIGDGEIADVDISASAAIATSKLSGPLTAVSGHGLGSLATASAVGSAEITDGAVGSTDIADGTIADADVSGTAAIATSKLSGAITSISGHGLGSLANLSAVSSTQITDGTIADADISGTAAINSTKISFVTDGISGDKIDGGKISNFASTGIDDNASTTAMTIDSSGYVGIGTTSPAGLLDVGATSQFRISSTGDMAKLKGVAYSWPSAQGGASTVLSNDGSGNLSWTAASGASQWTTSSTDIYYNSGNVGIGTTSPSAHLQVHSTTASSSRRFSLTDATTGATATDGLALIKGSDEDGWLWNYENSALRFGTNNTQRVSILNNGNVGIGTSAPGGLLDVGATPLFRVSSTGNVALIRGIAYSWPSSQGSASTVLTNDGSGVLTWASPGVASQWTTSGSNIYYNSGNVGIGTTAPSGILHVAGATSIFGAGESATPSASTIRGANASGTNIAGANMTIQASNGTGTGGSGSILLQTASAGSTGATANTLMTRVAITSGGNVGIGTTSPGAKLTVSGGQAIGTYVASSSSTIDWNSGNIQSTDVAAGAITFTAGSMLDGGAYTLALTNATGGSYSFSSTGLTFKCNPACPVTVSAGKETVVTMIKAGSKVYVSWVKDFQ
jgi:hypothetical protein